MSQTPTKPLGIHTAEQIANLFIAELTPHSRRIEPVGALRRRQMSIWRVSLLIIPSIDHDSVFPINLVNQQLEDWIVEGKIKKHVDKEGRTRWGDVHKRAVFGETEVNFHLVMDPAQWGYQLAIKTGPEDYTRLLVTKREKGGMLPNNLSAKGGYIWQDGIKSPIETFEEADFFKLLYINEVPDPQERGRDMVVRKDERVSA